MNKTERLKILGAILIPDHKIKRFNEKLGFHHVSFPKEVIKAFKNKFDKVNKDTQLTKNHTSEYYKSAFLSKSFILNSSNREPLHLNHQDYPNGTWMIEYTFKNDSEYHEFLSSDANGFSVEIEYSIIDENGIEHHLRECFKMMNKLSELLSFNVFVRGGSTGGAGRNEHGAAHFEIHQKNSNKNIGKIFMPTLELWSNSNLKEKISLLTVDKGIDISKREKKAMVKWLEKENNENLIRCHKEWNRMNKDNNQTILI